MTKVVLVFILFFVSSTLAKPLKAIVSEDKLKNVFDIIENAVKDKTFPGGVLVIGDKKGHVIFKTFGSQTYEANSQPVTADTIYDLASLTKVIVTTTACMKLYEEGVLNLDARVSSFIPEFSKHGKEMITIRHLLTHSSGLPAYKKYYLEAKGKEDIIKKICDEKLEYEPGTKSIYSDLGFILLGKIIENITGECLDSYIHRIIFNSLEMKSSFFNPPMSLIQNIAPTENDPWRKRIVHGEVHDENAYVMGGISGHAGLFSAAGDIAKFCQMMLNGGSLNHARILKRSTIELFTQKTDDIQDSSVALGWYKPAIIGSSGGKFLSDKAYGHTGFTGTSIWIDSQKDLFVVFLSNRVYPTRENIKIRDIRPKIHDAVIKSIYIKNGYNSKTKDE